MLRIVLLGEGEERNGSKGEGMRWDDMYADSLNQVRVAGCVWGGDVWGESPAWFYSPYRPVFVAV